MKVSGYLLTRKNGDVSGSAHRSTVDFWVGKDDSVQPMYSHADVMEMIIDCKFGLGVIESLESELNDIDENLQGEIEHLKKVLSEKKSGKGLQSPQVVV